jgi:hypothetical protein
VNSEAGHRKNSRRSGCGLWLVLAGLHLLSGCGPQPFSSQGDFGGRDPSDFEPVPDDGDLKADGMAGRFSPNRIMDDDYFLAWDAVDEEAIQAFLEKTPYPVVKNRRLNWPSAFAYLPIQFEHDGVGRSALLSEVLVELAAEFQLNPLLLLARMQIEQSLIGETTFDPSGIDFSKPASFRSVALKALSRVDLDHALGYGCPDYRKTCLKSEGYLGLYNQLRRAAELFRETWDLSVADANVVWKLGKATRTLDVKPVPALLVRPVSHATAALYAYTPHVGAVQTKSGWAGKSYGNWLVWNVTRLFEQHFKNTLDHWNYVAPGWAGDGCSWDDDRVCRFISPEGKQGYCAYSVAGSGMMQGPGFCSMQCTGYCNEQNEVHTLCVAVSPGAARGMCAPKAIAGSCSDFPGTVLVRDMPRYVGNPPQAPDFSDDVCLPQGSSTIP